VELATKHDGDMRLVKSDIKHQEETFENRVRAVVEGLEESWATIKECVADIQKAAMHFSDGQHRFVKIESDLALFRAKTEEDRIKVKDDFMEKAREKKEEEKEYRKGIICQFGVVYSFILAFFLFLIFSHGDQLGKFILKLFKVD
jgi:hypothetical protein